MSYDGLVHFLIFKYTIYVHGRKICNLFVRALETDRKTSLCRTFLTCFAASERVQINFLFTDKVRISNAKKSKATSNCLKRTETIVTLMFSIVYSVLCMNQVPENLLGPWISNAEIVLTPLYGNQLVWAINNHPLFPPIEIVLKPLSKLPEMPDCFSLWIKPLWPLY
jgi:hypothetical protein